MLIWTKTITLGDNIYMKILQEQLVAIKSSGNECANKLHDLPSQKFDILQPQHNRWSRVYDVDF